MASHWDAIAEQFGAPKKAPKAPAKAPAPAPKKS